MHNRKTFLLALLFLSTLAVFSSAATQREEFTLSASAVDKLVEISWAQGFTQFVSGYEYAGTVKVEWAIPQSALSGITAQKVRVFVKAAAKDNSSGIFFKRGEMNAQEYYFVLECNVLQNENGSAACGENSSLEREFSVFFDAPKDVQNASAQVSIEVELEPFIEAQNNYPDFAVNYEVGKEIESAENKVEQTTREVAVAAQNNPQPIQIPFLQPPATQQPLQQEQLLAEAKELLEKARESEALGNEKEAIDFARKAGELAGSKNAESSQNPGPKAGGPLSFAGQAASNALNNAAEAGRGAASAITGLVGASLAPIALGTALLLALLEARRLLAERKHGGNKAVKHFRSTSDDDEWL